MIFNHRLELQIYHTYGATKISEYDVMDTEARRADFFVAQNGDYIQFIFRWMAVRQE
jgi:hypothetical protein